MSNKQELAKIAKEIKSIKASLGKTALTEQDFDVIKSAARKGWLQVNKAAQRAGMTIHKGLKDAGSKIPTNISSPYGSINFHLTVPRSSDISKFRFGVGAVFTRGKSTSSKEGPAIWGYEIEGESLAYVLDMIQENVDFALRWISKNI